MVNDPAYMPNSATLRKVALYLGMHMEDLLYDDEEGDPGTDNNTEESLL